MTPLYSTKYRSVGVSVLKIPRKESCFVCFFLRSVLTTRKTDYYKKKKKKNNGFNLKSRRQRSANNSTILNHSERFETFDICKLNYAILKCGITIIFLKKEKKIEV